MKVMLLFLSLISCLTLTNASFSVADKDKDKDKGKDKDDGHDLTGLCAKLADAIFDKKIFCECTVFLPLRGHYELTCGKENICLGDDVVCGSLVWIGSFKFLEAAELKTSLCIADIEWDLPPITATPEDICIEYAINLRDELNPATSFARRRKRRGEDVQEVQDCTVSVGSTQCASCTPCDNVGSVKFDCSNIPGGYIVNECIPFRPMIDSRIETNDMS
jgi:hypothetical protein